MTQEQKDFLHALYTFRDTLRVTQIERNARVPQGTLSNYWRTKKGISANMASIIMRSVHEETCCWFRILYNHYDWDTTFLKSNLPNRADTC